MMATITRDGELTAPWGFTVTLRGREAGTALRLAVNELIGELPLYETITVHDVEAIRLVGGRVVAIKQGGGWLNTPPDTPLEVRTCESNPKPVVLADEEADHA